MTSRAHDLSPREVFSLILDTADSQTQREMIWQIVEERDRLHAALTEISELDLEGDANLADALHIADEALNPSPLSDI